MTPIAITDNTRLIDLNVAQFKEVIAAGIQAQVTETVIDTTKDEFVYGLDGIAKFINCSKSTRH